MTDDQRTTLRNALSDEHRRLQRVVYPGDLASQILHTDRHRPWWIPRVAALALIALGVSVGLVWMLQPTKDQPLVIQAEAAPVPEPDPAEVELIAPDSTTPPPASAPVVQIAQASTSPLPEIDRALLPLHHRRGQTWLAMPNAHTRQIARQARLAEQVDAQKPKRLRLSSPTKRSVDRLFQRPPTPKPKRTQPC